MGWEYNNYLAHHGVKGQKWGVRRYQNEDGSLTWLERRRQAKEMKRIAKEAKKDAEETARAKAYYGEGAGTRRKQIKNLTSEKMKDPRYKEELERQLAKQNMAEHQRKATNERHRRDTVAYATRTAKSAARIIFGVSGVTLGTLAVLAVASSGGASKVINNVGSTPLSSLGQRGYMHDVSRYKWN